MVPTVNLALGSHTQEATRISAAVVAAEANRMDLGSQCCQAHPR